MKRIEIKKSEDIEILSQLTGYEEYYIYVDLPYEIHTKTIDLADFKGNIYLSLDNRRHKLYAKSSNIKDSFLFLENVSGKKIYVLGNSETYNCFYKEIVKEIHVNNETDFKKALKSKSKHVIILDKDIIIHSNAPLTVPNNTVLKTNNHHIYYPATISITYPEEYQETFQFINEIITLKNNEDLSKLYHLHGDTILIEFKSDIKNAKMKSFNIPENTKTVYICGNNHAIVKSDIYGDKYNGLFSVIPAETSLIVKDIHFRYIHLKGKKNVTKASGLVFGSHGNDETISGSRAPIVINNCSFKQCLIENCRYAGVISGSDHFETKVINCDIDQIVYDNSYLNSLFGSSEVFNIAYYEDAKVESALTLKRKKNV